MPEQHYSMLASRFEKIQYFVDGSQEAIEITLFFYCVSQLCPPGELYEALSRIAQGQNTEDVLVNLVDSVNTKCGVKLASTPSLHCFQRIDVLHECLTCFSDMPQIEDPDEQATVLLHVYFDMFKDIVDYFSKFTGFSGELAKLMQGLVPISPDKQVCVTTHIGSELASFDIGAFGASLALTLPRGQRDNIAWQNTQDASSSIGAMLEYMVRGKVLQDARISSPDVHFCLCGYYQAPHDQETAQQILGVMASLAPQGRAMFFVPASVLNRDSFRHMREEIIRSYHLEAVVSLNNSLSPASRMAYSLFVASKVDAGKNSVTVFVDSPAIAMEKWACTGIGNALCAVIDGRGQVVNNHNIKYSSVPCREVRTWLRSMYLGDEEPLAEIDLQQQYVRLQNLRNVMDNAITATDMVLLNLQKVLDKKNDD